MLTNSALAVLIAQTDQRLERLAGGFRKNRAQFDSSDIVLFLVILAFVFAAIWLAARWSEWRAGRNSPLGLFWTLGKAHGIPRRDRWLLWRIARGQRVAEPALVFLDPRLTSPQFVPRLTPEKAARLKAFRRTVFFGIDRIARDEGGVAAEGIQESPAGQAPVARMPALPDEAQPRAEIAELGEVLDAIRAFSLQDQNEPKHAPPEGPAPDAKKGHPSPTAEFPVPNAPVLELYPWLGNDWEITGSDR